MVRTLKLGLVAALVVALSALGGLPAVAKDKGKGGKNKVEIQYNCKKTRFKPKHIEVGCNKHDSRADLRRVEYRDKDYGDKRVRGKADFTAGTAGNNKVDLRFKKLKKCKGDKVYKSVTVKFKNSAPSGHSKSEKYKLDC
jgi:hypothetical protein